MKKDSLVSFSGHLRRLKLFDRNPDGSGPVLASGSIDLLEEILRTGGGSVFSSVETANTDWLGNTEINNNLVHIFDVLAADLAVVLPQDLLGEKRRLKGLQLCKGRLISGVNWYKDAIRRYFSFDSGVSLMILESVSRLSGKWWTIYPESFPDGNSTTEHRGVTKWSNTFEPGTLSSEDLTTRFEDFGNIVFRQLSKHGFKGRPFILWVYVGSTDRDFNSVDRWGVSLFSVLSTYDDSIIKFDTNNFYRSLSCTAEKIFHHLSDSAFLELETNRLRRFQSFSNTQVVAHDFKNLAGELAVLGESVYNDFNHRISEGIFRDPDNETLQNFTTSIHRLKQFSDQCKHISSIAYVSFWLNNIESSINVEFVKGEIDVFAAMVVFLLHAHVEDSTRIRSRYSFQGQKELEKFFCVKNVETLFEALDYQMLYYLLVEPVRNAARALNLSQFGRIKVQVHCNHIVLRQTCLEANKPSNFVISHSARRINSMIKSSRIDSKLFGELDSQVLTSNFRRTDSGWIVIRITKVYTYGAPRLSWRKK